MDEFSKPDYEFGGFRLDTTQQILVSPSGEPIPLPSRAFEALRHLVERAGELVERPALMKAVWPRAVVEESNLSQCILTLRRALGEEAGDRRFILTVPGRGFKFVAPVRVVPRIRQRLPQTEVAPPAGLPPADTAPASPGSTAVPPPDARGRPRRWPAIAVAAAALLTLAIGAWLGQRPTAPVTSPAEFEALTDVADSATAPAISPDGHFLAFIRGGGAFISSGQLWLKTLPDGEPVQLTHATSPLYAPSFAPDGTHVVYTSILWPSAWDTWSVPITGGEPVRLLPNASGLTYLGAHEVLYSEFKTGIHLGIVTSGDDRSRHREVYLPAHERGMAHFAYLSPDHVSVLVVEMGRDGDWQRCRLVPFDASSAGRPIGPDGACMSAAWSPDGTWMYFNAFVRGHSHLWRQRFPNGAPQQLTFGPGDEDTVAVAPDGRSLLTSLGQARSALWLHDASGDRALTAEGEVWAPWLSADAHRVYFLTDHNAAGRPELARLDVNSGQRDSLLTGFAVNGFAVSSDEQQVAFGTTQAGSSEIWIAPLDRHVPPRMLARDADEVAFDAAGRVYLRRLGAAENYLHRADPDRAGDVRILETPILEFMTVSPDGNWVIVDRPIEGSQAGSYLTPLHGGEARVLTRGWWPSRWSRDGERLYLEVGESEASQRHGRTAVLPIGRHDPSSDTATLIHSAIMQIPHAEDSLAIGSDPSVYVYVRWEDRRNIYRIPLH